MKCARWIEQLISVAVAAIALVAAYEVFVKVPAGPSDQTLFSELWQRANVLGNISSPIKRDSMCLGWSALARSIDAQIPRGTKLFLLHELGPKNAGNLGYYYFLNYYLFPHKVGISVGEPLRFNLAGVAEGREPTSDEELAKAGYDLAIEPTPDGRWQFRALKQMPAPDPEVKPPPIAYSDKVIAFFLPLVVALAGTRLVRWLFKDLEGILSLGELLASGLAVGAFVSTQAILGFRMAGLKLERWLALAVAIVAVIEVVLFLRRLRAHPPRLTSRHWWWLLLIPAALMLCCLFRLAGVEGLLEFDAVAFWAFKAKIFFYCAGSGLWKWFHDPSLVYAHLDYPLLASLLHTFTYGAIGHVDEFVTKFWNQWMLLFLAWAMLGAGRFPRQKPWLIASLASIVVLLPMALDFTRTEGATTPMFFYSVLSFMQLAIGMTEKEPGRLRLGLLLIMATAMVKFEGIILVAMWVVVLLLDKDSRALFWPIRRLGWAAVVGASGWMPYVLFRLQKPLPHPESAWLSQLFHHFGTVMSMAPMTCLAFLSRRFLRNDFADWAAPDNLHAVWQGNWTGLQSLIDHATLGMGWVCLLLLIAAWLRGGKVRWTVVWLSLLFLAFVTTISIVWCAVRSNPMNYQNALNGSVAITGGRYIYPVLMAWFAGSLILLVRSSPAPPAANPVKPVKKTRKAGSSRKKR